MKIFGFDPFNAPVRKKRCSIEKAREAQAIVVDAYSGRKGISGVGIGIEKDEYFVVMVYLTDNRLTFKLPESVNGIYVRTKVVGKQTQILT
jgi:hypothetical protein